NIYSNTLSKSLSDKKIKVSSFVRKKLVQVEKYSYYNVSIGTAMSHRFYLPGRDKEAQTRRNILAVDIGGTKTSFGVFEVNGNKLTLIREETFGSRSLGTFEEILQKFLAGGNLDIPEVLSIGVAGP